MLQNFAEIAGGVATLNVRSTLHGVFKTAFRLKQLADGEIPPEEQAPFSQWPGTDEPWDPATLDSDPNPAYDPDPPPSSQDDDDGPGWFGPNGPFYFPPISPLVLDLDGDGLDIVQIEESNAYFDLDEDGFAEKTAWIGADDGFLARDVNGNGQIDDLAELFGGKEVDGFTTLAALDSNGDGWISSFDAAFSELIVWRDTNGDGLSGANEFSTLADLGIAGISLEADFVNYWNQGNWISHQSSYIQTDGAPAPLRDSAPMRGSAFHAVFLVSPSFFRNVC